MTISSTIRKAGPYSGNAITVSFPFTFKVFATSDVYVVQTDLFSVETVKALTTDYTVVLNPDQNASAGGTVTMLIAPPAGYLLTISSQVPNLQPTDITNNSGFYPKVVVDALDRLTILVQQLALGVASAIQVPISSSQTPSQWLSSFTTLLSDYISSASSSASSALSSANSATTAASTTVASVLSLMSGYVSSASSSALSSANSATTAAGYATTFSSIIYDYGIITDAVGVTTDFGSI